MRSQDKNIYFLDGRTSAKDIAGIKGDGTMVCNSKKKGSAGEREAAKALNAVLPHAKARRAQQYAGHETAADLVCEGLDGVMVEVKRRQSMNIHKVMKEAQATSTDAQLPMILHRKDGEEWLLTIRLEDLPKALEKLNLS